MCVLMEQLYINQCTMNNYDYSCKTIKYIIIASWVSILDMKIHKSEKVVNSELSRLADSEEVGNLRYERSDSDFFRASDHGNNNIDNFIT